jgi:hypothetical protein
VGRVEYADGDGPPIVRRVVRTHKTIERLDGKEPLHYEQVVTYDLRIDADVSEAEFTLSAFGIKEPRGIVWDHDTSRWWLWFLALGAVSLAVGAYFRWRTRQSARTLPAQPTTSPTRT